MSEIHSHQPQPSMDQQIDFTERRSRVEMQMGSSISGAFEEHADYIQLDPDTGAENLTLYIPRRDRFATFEVSRIQDEEGNTTVDMSFGAKNAWDNHWRYTEDSMGVRRLVPCDRDPETGKLTPIQPPEPRGDGTMPYDATSDKEVGFWGEVVARNFENGSPEAPSRSRKLRNLGRRALRAIS